MNNSTSNDPFEDLLGLEDHFYQEGYDAGVSDSEYAGLIEGKVFGIEKGYEKALELAKLQGRALIWQLRSGYSSNDGIGMQAKDCSVTLASKQYNLTSTSKNSRLPKHVDTLLTLTNARDIHANNTDEAVAEFDERLAKAQAKAKVVANIIDEPLKPNVNSQSSIEEATGLSARH